MIEREALQKIQKWHKKPSRKPLILRGARQVGKSTLVRMFCAASGLELNEVNLERHLYLNDVFKTLDTDLILNELSAVTGKNIRKPGSVLFLDEIQAVPEALPMLRYFYEEFPQMAVIAAGSLLEFTLAEHHFSMPVGRIEYLHLGPCTFREYIHAMEPSLLPFLDEYVPGTDFPVSAHRKLLQRQREFFFIGGFPEAIFVYRESRSLEDVIDVHRSIIETYQDDFSKYVKRDRLPLVHRVFNYIPRSVGKKVKYSNIAREERSGLVRDVIQLLKMARICHAVYHTHASGIPLSSEQNENVYKLLFMDIGLMNSICGNDWLLISGMTTADLVNEGAMAEQFIGQHLAGNAYREPDVHYWLREGHSSNAEIDYLFARGNLILPVEVKAGKSGSLKSLQQFILHRQSKYAVRFDLNVPSLQRVRHTAATADGNAVSDFYLLSLPLYMVELLPALVDQLREREGLQE